MATVRIRGFNNVDEAEAFISWWECGGRYSYDECRHDEVLENMAVGAVLELSVRKIN